MEGDFLGFHDPERAWAGEARKGQAWLAALAACDARQPAVLRWLFAGGWPMADAERLPWHFRDMADPSILTWYTEERPCLDVPSESHNHFNNYSRADVTAIDWRGQGEWGEMGKLAGLLDPPSQVIEWDISGRIRGKPGACQEWFPQEFQVLWRACRSGSFACQQVIVEAGCRSRWVTVLAALTGQLPFLRFAIEQGCPCEGSTLVAAASGGHLDSFEHVLKTCAETVGKVPFHVQRDVLAVGSPDCSPDSFFMKRFGWDYDRGQEIFWDDDLELTVEGDSDIGLDDCILKAATAASANGHLDVLTSLMARQGEAIRENPAWGDPASAAVSRGRLRCLEFLYTCGCVPDREHVRLALETGHTECVRFVLAHRLEPDGFDYHAAKSGRLEFLELHKGRGTDVNHNGAACGAAIGGQLACLRFVLENVEPRESLSFALLDAAIAGSVSCMRYLYEKGARPWAGTLWEATESGSLECVEFALDIGCQHDDEAMRNAARREQGLALVQCLHERGLPWGHGTTMVAARRGCLATVRYCHEHGCSWDGSVVEGAMESAACLQYIHTHDCPPLPDPCPSAYNFDALQYAVDNMGDWGKKVLQATSRYLLEDDQHQFADWRLLMYLAKNKVALAPVLQRAVDARIARFEAVVSCFHHATRLAGQGAPHAPMWAAMGMIPHPVVEQITRLANLKL
jgi:hypothetical protein